MKTPSWDEEGFDADDSGGFAAEEPSVRPHQAAEPAVASAAPVTPAPSTHADNASAHGGTDDASPRPPVGPRIMVTPPVADRTSAARNDRSTGRTLGRAFLLLALIAIVVGGGYIVSTFFLRDPVEDQIFYAREDMPTARTEEPGEPPAPANVPPVDSSTPASATEVPAAAAARPQQPAVPPAKRPAAAPPAVKKDTKEAASPAGALWAVQVYSSPSRDDAGDWLQTIRQKNINDGYVAEQEIRGQSWFRVRFGQFTSRGDAEEAARRYGFRQPWIARIR